MRIDIDGRSLTKLVAVAEVTGATNERLLVAAIDLLKWAVDHAECGRVIAALAAHADVYDRFPVASQQD